VIGNRAAQTGDFVRVGQWIATLVPLDEVYVDAIGDAARAAAFRTNGLDQLKNASGLFNLTRNLGGAVGLAILNTELNDRIDRHLVRLHEALNWARVPATEMLAQLTTRFNDFGADAQTKTLKQPSLLVRQQSLVMSFADVFFMLAVVFVAFAAVAIVMRRPVRAAAVPWTLTAASLGRMENTLCRVRFSVAELLREPRDLPLPVASRAGER
jgi:hypothetical protein